MFCVRFVLITQMRNGLVMLLFSSRLTWMSYLNYSNISQPSVQLSMDFNQVCAPVLIYLGLRSCVGLFRLEVFKDFIIILTNMKLTFYDWHIIKTTFYMISLLSIMRMKEKETMEEYYIFWISSFISFWW